MAIADLHAKTVEWTGTHTVRITYDWTDANQLLDWTPTTGATLTRNAGTSTISITGGSTDVRGMKWAQQLAVSKITSHGRITSASPIALNPAQTNLNGAWMGTPWNANPGLCCTYSTGGGNKEEFVVNGANVGSFATSIPVLVQNQWIDSVAEFSTTAVYFTCSAMDATRRGYGGTFAPDTSAYCAVGCYNQQSEWGTIVIEGTTTETQPSGDVSATSAPSLVACTSSASLSQSFSGSSTASLIALAAVTAAASIISATCTGTLGVMTSVASTGNQINVTSAPALGAIASTANCTQNFSGSSASSLVALTAATNAASIISATCTSSLVAPTAAATIGNLINASSAPALVPLACVSAGVQSTSGTSTGALVALACSSSGSVGSAVTATGTGFLVAPTSSASGTQTESGASTGSLVALTSTASATVGTFQAIAITSPAHSVSAAPTVATRAIAGDGGTFNIPYIQTSTTLACSATVTAGQLPSGGGVRFVLDMGTSSAVVQDSVGGASPFSTSFSGVAKGEHTLDVYVIDSAHAVQSGSGNHAATTKIGIGDIILMSGDSITAGYPYSTATALDWLAVTSSEQAVTVSNDSRNYPQYDTGSNSAFRAGFLPALNNLLSAAYGYPVFCLSDAVSGISTGQFVTRMAQTAWQNRTAALAPNKFTINLGGNDAYSSISAATVESNLRSIIATLKSTYGATSSNIWIARPINLPENGPNNIESQYCTRVGNIVGDGTAQAGPDTFTFFTNNAGLRYTDNLHLNPAGNTAIAGLWDAVLASIGATSAPALVAPTATSAATLTITATSSVTMVAETSAASAAPTINATCAISLPAETCTTTCTMVISATSAPFAGSVFSLAIGVQSISGTCSASLAALEATGAAIIGSYLLVDSAADLQPLTCSAVCDVTTSTHSHYCFVAVARVGNGLNATATV